MQRVRGFLRKILAGWLAIEAAAGIVAAVAFVAAGQYTEAVVVLVLVAVFGSLSWRLASRRARRDSP